MGQCDDKLHEEAARGHCPPYRAPPRAEHQDDIQEHARRSAISGALDLALQLLVRHFRFCFRADVGSYVLMHRGASEA